MVVAGDFRISPQSMRTGAQGMQRAAEDLRSAVVRLQGQVEGAGSPWGADELGSVFGETYTVVTQNGLQALAHLGDVLESVAAGLAREAENTQTTDERAAAAMDGLA
jgi:uncharacterized protein YukE